MRVVIDNIDLSARTIEQITEQIRSLFPECEGIGYSPVEKTLELEFPEEEFEGIIRDKINQVVAKIRKSHPNAKLHHALMGEDVEWVL